MRFTITSAVAAVDRDDTAVRTSARSSVTAAPLIGAVVRRACVVVGLVLASLLADAAVALATPAFTGEARRPRRIRMSRERRGALTHRLGVGLAWR
jgi:hypothetical protein